MITPGIVESFWDITSRKEAEEALHESEDEVEDEEDQQDLYVVFRGRRHGSRGL